MIINMKLNLFIIVWELYNYVKIIALELVFLLIELKEIIIIE